MWERSGNQYYISVDGRANGSCSHVLGVGSGDDEGFGLHSNVILIVLQPVKLPPSKKRGIFINLMV